MGLGECLGTVVYRGYDERGGFGRHVWVVLGGGFAERESGEWWYWGVSQRV